MTGPNPVRAVESKGIIDQTTPQWDRCADDGCNMVSIRVNSPLVRFVEECTQCGWIDGASLTWWAEDAIKQSGSKRAQRIAVAATTDPFAFVQSTGEDLTLHEMVSQGLAAASVAGPFDKDRGVAILSAMMAEIMRFQRIAEGKALSEVRRRIGDLPQDALTRSQVLAAIR